MRQYVRDAMAREAVQAVMSQPLMTRRDYGSGTPDDDIYLDEYDDRVRLTKTIDNDWMVLVDGLQSGEDRDPSGASSQTWPTAEAAEAAAHEMMKTGKVADELGFTRPENVKDVYVKQPNKLITADGCAIPVGGYIASICQGGIALANIDNPQLQHIVAVDTLRAAAKENICAVNCFVQFYNKTSAKRYGVYPVLRGKFLDPLFIGTLNEVREFATNCRRDGQDVAVDNYPSKIYFDDNQKREPADI
jgi:hypothetical protein